MPTKTEWDQRFLRLARHVSGWSKDPSTQTGAVVVDSHRRVVSVGYNGFPVGIHDDDRLQDRELKYRMILHCEMNAILFARSLVSRYTLYTWPFMSCARCAAVIIQAGIIRCVAPPLVVGLGQAERWGSEFELSTGLFHEAGVELVLLSGDWSAEDE